MDSVTDFCKYYFLCLVTIIPTGQGHIKSPGKKGQTKKIRDVEMWYMLLCQILSEETEKCP